MLTDADANDADADDADANDTNANADTDADTDPDDGLLPMYRRPILHNRCLIIYADC